jgi:hypothetical protein
MSAISCNWLHNGRTTDPQGLLSGAYDLGTFGRLPDNTLTDQLTRSPGARFWIPSQAEWLTAAHYDPSKAGPGSGGWSQYPTSSDTAPVSGLPGTQGAQTSTGLFQNSYSVRAYPTVQSPWGLLDTSGGGTEWTESILFGGSEGARIWEGDNVLSETEFWPFDDPRTPRVFYGTQPGEAPWGQILRIAAAIPGPSGAGLLAMGPVSRAASGAWA